MSTKSCTACNDLREYAPEFVLNGVDDDVAEHLQKNEGLGDDDGHYDCGDLLDVNDCLIGNMIDAMDSYDTCEWKDFMSSFIGNLYETLKAMIYSECGLWCGLNALTSGVQFAMTYETSDDAYVVAGKGVSYLTSASATHSTKARITYVAGGLARIAGSFKFYSSSFTDADSVPNFDNGSTMSTSSSRSGNSYWNTIATSGPWAGGELIAEFRINREAYPQIGTLFAGSGQETGSGDFSVNVAVFEAGQTAYGQHGKPGDGDDGHTVPTGWVYIQLRMSSAGSFSAASDGTTRSPRAWLGMRMNIAELDCYTDEEEESD